MENLMKKDDYLMNSKDLAELMGKRHDHVLRDIKDEIEKLSQQGIITDPKFGFSEYIDSTGRKLPLYTITKEGAMQMATRYDAKIRHEVITYLDNLEKKKSKMLPSNYIEALEALINAEKEKVLLLDKNTELLAKTEEMKPKAEFFDAVADSKDAVEISVVAKVIGIKGMGRNNLFAFLRDNNILRQNNQPYQTYVDRNWFRVIEQKYNKPDGSICINIKTLVYQKGVDGIRKLLEEKGEQNGTDTRQ